jgi:phage shock protein PspC (stress-responsive transcriptional regulator)
MLKDFWATRPTRPRRGRKIAGVAAGIAARYRIDPTLVRVGFLVAAIYGGVGLLLYLVGWLTLPEQDDETSPFESLIGKGRSSTSKFFTVVLCIAVFPVGSWVFSGFFPGWMGLLIAVGLLYLLHRGRGDVRPAPVAAEMPMAPPMPYVASPVTDVPPTPVTMPMATPSTPSTESTESVQDVVAPEPAPEPEPAGPPAWDPLGAAPFAWDLPEPTPVHTEPEPPAPRRRKSKIGVMTVAAALITGAGMLIIADTWGGFDEQTAVGVVLGVIGIGMVIGAFVRGGRGLIGLAVPLAVVGIGLTTVSPSGWDGVGDMYASPVSSRGVLSDYERSVGNVTLDLSKIPAADEQIHTRVKTDVGDVLIIVPKDADVELECQVGAGDIDCLGEKRHDFDAEVSEFLSEGTDGPGGLQIDLDAEVATAGNVEVRRG